MDSPSTTDRVLLALKSRGPLTAQDIAEAFAMSVMGAHKTLATLSCAGLVRHEDVVEGRGRPRRVFSLTEAGHGRFPDRHADLNRELIELIRATFGQEGLDRLVGEREARQRTRYVSTSGTTLPEKVTALAEARAAEGYMARSETCADGSCRLIEDHCPICAAASACEGFCRSELEIFRAVLGPGVEVKREEHLMSGGRRCTYRIATSEPG
jgi:predicted ArsR family transcriptional regulator